MLTRVAGVPTYALCHAVGLIVASAILVGGVWSARPASRRPILLAWAVLVSFLGFGALLGAPDFRPTAGLRYPGVGIAVLLSLPFALHVLRGKVAVAAFADSLAVPLAVALGIAKAGCFFHGCCHGTPTVLPWGVSYPERSLVWFEQLHAGQIGRAAATSLPVHPLPLYTTAWCFLVAGIGAYLARMSLREGQRFLIVMALLMAGVCATEIQKASGGEMLPMGTFVLSLFAGMVAVARALSGYSVVRPGFNQR